MGLLCFGATMVNAQSFLTYSGAADTVSKAYEPGEMQVANYLKSNTGSPVMLNWRITGIDTSAGWHFGGFCDNNQCYTASAGVLINSYSPTYGTSFEDFHVNFDGDDAPMGSSAWVQVRVFDPASGDSRNLTFIAYKSPTGVTTMPAAKTVRLWPNPASGAVNVSFDANAGIRHAVVYNTIGKMVGQYRVQGSSAKLDISNLPAGIYLLRLAGAKGEVVETKRFTVK